MKKIKTTFFLKLLIILGTVQASAFGSPCIGSDGEEFAVSYHVYRVNQAVVKAYGKEFNGIVGPYRSITSTLIPLDGFIGHTNPTINNPETDTIKFKRNGKEDNYLVNVSLDSEGVSFDVEVSCH